MSTRLLYGPPMRRFEDLIERQIAIFCEDYADLMTACTAAERAYDRAGADEAEERYAAFLELVEEGSEALADIRDTYASTLDPDLARRTSGRSTRRSRASSRIWVGSQGRSQWPAAIARSREGCDPVAVSQGLLLFAIVSMIVLEMQHLRWIWWEYWDCRDCG